MTKDNILALLGKQMQVRVTSNEKVEETLETSGENDIVLIPEYKKISITTDASNLVTNSIDQSQGGIDKYFYDIGSRYKHELTWNELTADLIGNKKLEIYIYNTLMLETQKYVCTAILLNKNGLGVNASQIGRLTYISSTYGICEAYVYCNAESKLTIYETNNKLMFGNGFVVDIKVMEV